MYTTPILGITGPDQDTEFRNLGTELRQMLNSIDDTLAGFDYNGADPNLVLARVTALETWRTLATAKIATLEERTPATGYKAGPDIPPGGNTVVSVTFPAGQFSTAPHVFTEIDTTALARRKATLLRVFDVTPTGCQVTIYNEHATATFAVGFNWIAVAP